MTRSTIRHLWAEEKLEAAERPSRFDHFCVLVSIVALLYFAAHWIIGSLR